MNLRKHGLRAIGLSLLAALGLMAFMATAAQAKEGLFLINGSTANLLATATGGIIGAFGTLLVETLGVEVLCTALKALAGSEIFNAHEGLASIRYEGCTYLVTASLPTKPGGAACTIFDPLAGGGKENGVILAKATLKPILVKLAGGTEHKLLILAEGDETVGKGLGKNRFALIHQTGCTTPPLVEVTGNTVIKLLAADVAKQEFIEAPEAERLLTPNLNVDQLFFGANKAFIDGEAFVSLSGTHLNQPWGST